jgi:hypothetical protein
MSAAIHLTEDSLIVEIGGLDRFWALKSRLEIPLANVVNAEPAGAEAAKWWRGLRLGGTDIPGVIAAGRFYSHGQWVFWDVHDPARAIAIELRDQRYDRLVIEVEDPAGTVAKISRAQALAAA